MGGLKTGSKRSRENTNRLAKKKLGKGKKRYRSGLLGAWGVVNKKRLDGTGETEEEGLRG